MRRGLRAQLPALSHFYGIRPWDLDRMTYGEIETYLSDLAEIAKAQKDQARKG